MTVTASHAKLTHGFRRDPMQFVENDRSLQGALVRTLVFARPAEGDAGLIQKRIDEILAEQRADGAFGETSKETGERLLRLLELGLPHDRPEVGRAAEAVIRQKRAGENANEWVEKEGALSIYALHALCLLGRTDFAEVGQSLQWYLGHPEEWNDPWQGCPWTPEVFWSALWAGRGLADTAGTVNAGIRRVTQGMNAAGCNAFNDPWGFTDAAGQIDSGEARDLIRKQLPMILRGQRDDGGWGERSLPVFRALVTHGFFERLQELPPLPEDWRVVRSIPAPEGDPFTLAWDGARLWVYCKGPNHAVAISPRDGAVMKTVKLPVEDVFGIGWWEGALAVTQTKPKRLLKIDPESGAVRAEIDLGMMEWVTSAVQVGNEVWVGDGFQCHVRRVNPDALQDGRGLVLAGPGPEVFTAADGGVWHSDFWAPAIIKSDLDGALVDWGDQPFNVRGLAHDGEHLWAIDGEGKRICVLERAVAGSPSGSE